MKRRELISTLLTAVGLTALFTAAPITLAAPHPNAAAYAKCAKACRDCMRACQTCNRHCTDMVKSGMKGHEKMVSLTADCRDICALAAKLCERHGPMTAAICQACLQACTACGKECSQYPKMAPMAACSRSCAACAAACQEMIAGAK